MIKNRRRLTCHVADIIRNRIGDINEIYGTGPDLYFYHRVRELRRQHAHVESFLSSDTCLEILYATLVSWDMNSRRAQMKYFCDFKSNLVDSLAASQAVEAAFAANDREKARKSLMLLYDALDLMKSKRRLVANSKCLHFLFPALCLPIDSNTLKKLRLGDRSQPKDKETFCEILDFANDVVAEMDNPGQYLDDQWNTCDMKLVDNAISLLKQRRSRELQLQK